MGNKAGFSIPPKNPKNLLPQNLQNNIRKLKKLYLIDLGFIVLMLQQRTNL